MLLSLLVGLVGVEDDVTGINTFLLVKVKVAKPELHSVCQVKG